MELTLKKGDSTQLSPHFKASEFYSNSSDAPIQHPFFVQLVEAAELLRTHFNTPWRITSTYRTESHERRILAQAGVKFFVSQHMKGRAFDSQPANGDPAIMAELAADFTKGGPIYQSLRKIGISAFGIYDTFIHLDCRIDSFTASRKDSFGLVAHWDQRSTKKKAWGAAWTVTQKPTPTSPTNPRQWPKAAVCSGSCSR